MSKQEELLERFQRNFNDYMGVYLREKVFLPSGIAKDFVELVYMKHDNFNHQLLMEEITKAMRIHVHLNNPNTKRTRELV